MQIETIEAVVEIMGEIVMIINEDHENQEILDMGQNSVENAAPVNFGLQQNSEDFDVKIRICPSKSLNSDETERIIKLQKLY